jgi:hypothetical protein
MGAGAARNDRSRRETAGAVFCCQSIAAAGAKPAHLAIRIDAAGGHDN